MSYGEIVEGLLLAVIWMGGFVLVGLALYWLYNWVADHVA
jgi:hypothetical protein